MVDCIGRSGGLALMWDEEWIVDIQNYSQHHINGVIQTKPNRQPDATRRQETWSLLKILAHFTPFPWLCIGDFNEILTMPEKWGGNTWNNRQKRDFQKALEECE
jgi:hypothetical protein